MKQNELLGHIVIAVGETTKSPTSLIFGTRRNRTAMWSRWLVYLIAHDYCNLSYSAIGRALNRDHTTVLHGVKRATVEYERNAAFREAYIQATMEVRQWMEQQLSRTSTSLSNSLTCQLLRSMDVRTRYPQTSRVPSYGQIQMTYSVSTAPDMPSPRTHKSSMPLHNLFDAPISAMTGR